MESRDRDRLEQWLRGALRQNESAEPRLGLEGRVLARIAAESNRHRTLKGWAWIFATASVAALSALIGLGLGTESGNAPKRTELFLPGNSMTSLGHAAAPVSLTPVARHRSHRKRIAAMVRTMEQPKLDHFPSPRPLSQQELALESYAERFPDEAALIAREQRMFDQEIAKAQEEAENNSSASNQ
jgi:hypothetical protein